MPLMLSRWYLQLPINNRGGLSGACATLKPASNFKAGIYSHTKNPQPAGAAYRAVFSSIAITH